MVRIKENGVSYPANSNGEQPVDAPPALPQKTLNLAERRRLPVPPPPTADPPTANGGATNGFVLSNGHEPSEIYSNSEFDPEEEEESSMEGTSVDDEEEHLATSSSSSSSNPAFSRAEDRVRSVVSSVRRAREAMKERRKAGGKSRGSKKAFEEAREKLTAESR